MFTFTVLARLAAIVLLGWYVATPAQAQITGTGAAGALEATGLTATDACTFPCNYGNTTVPSGSNRLGLISVGMHTTGAAWSARTLTIGGEAATAIHDFSAGGATPSTTFCILDAQLPAPGSQAVVVSGTVGGINTDGQSAIITWLFGAEQTCPPALEDAEGAIASTTSVSTTLTPTVNGSLFYHAATAASNRLSTMAATSPQTLLHAQHGGGATGRTYGVSAEIVATAAQTTATMTWTGATTGARGGLIVEPAEAAPSGVPVQIW